MKVFRTLSGILLALTALLAVGWLASAAQAQALPPQPVPAAAASAPVPGAPSAQGSTTLPPDSSPFTPDSPEKEERVKKLIDQIIATYGFSRGREELLPSWGPRIDKLYSLHKKLTDSDWKLLAEMYFTFYNSNWKLVAGISLNFNDDSEADTRLDSAMTILLAMHGEASIKTLNAMMSATQSSKTSPGNIGMIKDIIKFPPWNDLPEYKKDQRRKNNLP
jgi:hypothetical protein